MIGSRELELANGEKFWTMATYSCVAIGINNYQFLQPLSYAQEDAEAIQKFLLEDAQIPVEQILLLTETSPPVTEKPTYPNRDTMVSWLNQLTSGSTLAKEQNFWFFFSGYGVNVNGEDYLLPINAQLQDLTGTGINVRSLFQAIKTYCPQQNLVFLDFNRSPGLVKGNPVGVKTLSLAQEMGINTIISTQGSQLSHESAELEQGLFTAALLEALRYYHRELTLHTLASYLSDRLPELSEHHWRPVQKPAIFIAHQNQLPILPTPIPSVEQLQAIPNTNGHLNGGVIQININQNNPNPLQVPVAIPNNSQPSQQPQQKQPPSQPGGIIPNQPMPDRAIPDGVTPQTPPPPVTPPSTPEGKNQSSKNPLYWGIVAGAATGAAVVGVAQLNNNGNLPNPNPSPTTTATSSPSPTVTNSPSPTVTSSPSPSPSPRISPSPSPTVSPTVSPSPENSPQLSQGDLILSRAASNLQNNQATNFSKAIEEALKIPKSDPAYKQARQEITRWSWVILDIALGRAIQGNLQGAIAAAKLVPKEEAPVYTIAQGKIVLWESQKEQEQLNRILIQETQKQILRNQASSYNRAITTLRKIRPGEPYYEKTQQLKEEWSKQIYLIANSRAASGDFTLAIQTAQLVPQDSSYNTKAQSAIARWKQGKK